MKNKIFISHSSKDINIVENFVELILILGLGINRDRIFCSSMEGQGVLSGEYIPDRLKQEINSSCLALLFISKNYKTSEVCINEIGAAWAVLEKQNVIPLLLPEIDFNKLGFLNLNTLGLKLDNASSILKFVEDCETELNTKYKPTVLHKQIQNFLKEPTLQKKQSVSLKKKNKQISEEEKCFEYSLIPFSETLRKSLPSKSDGIYEISNKTIQNKILTNLSKTDFLKQLWYRHSGGDYYIQKMTQLPNKNWIISGNNREIKISSMWVSIDIESQYEFILIHSDIQEPYNIQSDVGGKEFRVGILPNGTIVSENERNNGYAEINGETIDLLIDGVERRERDQSKKWVFFITDYHKLGFNANETIEFCEKLDSGEIEVNEENIKKFISRLPNHPTVMRFR
jgi:hypothetical protein